MEKNKIHNGIKCAAISLIVILAVSVVGVVQYGKAQVAKSEVAELTELATALNNVDAFKMGLAYLGDRVGLNLGATPGGDFYKPVTFHDSVIDNGTFNIELNWKQATSTTNGTTYIVLGKKRYTGIDKLICSGAGGDAFIYNSGLVPYTATYGLGTTTASDVNFLTATTSRGIIKQEVATSTSWGPAYGYILNADDNEGDYGREAFILNPQEVLVVSLDFTDKPFPTSTMPTTAAQGLTADGYAKLSCKKAE